MDKLKVVIADDERLFLQGITAMVQAQGEEFEVVGTASNGVDALRLVREQQPDILLTDIRMPKMDGIALIKQLEEENLSVLVIIISAYDDRQYIQYAIRSPLVYDYINKPFGREEFTEQLRTAAAYRRQQRGKSVRQQERNLSVLILSCLDIIDQRLEDSELSVSTVARELDVTDNYLSGRFSRDMDVSFTRYVTMARIERAMEYLRTTHMKIYEISEKLGFNDPRYFVKVFKENVGLRPSEYREQFIGEA